MNKAAPNHTAKPAAHNAAHRQKGVLSGIRVLDFTWKTVGPWAPRLLTHYGAEVIHGLRTRTDCDCQEQLALRVDRGPDPVG